MTTAAEPFVPRMELGWDDCDPIAVCDCGARLKGDSINDALIAWGKHITTVHRGGLLLSTTRTLEAAAIHDGHIDWQEQP